MHHRCESRVLLLCLFLVCQLVVVALYIWGGTPRTLPARFLYQTSKTVASQQEPEPTSDQIILPIRSVDEHFVIVNDTSCFRQGTDFRRKPWNGKCECLAGHHGNDCSLPEVIWRAFIAARHGAVISRRSGTQRRIVLVSDADGSSPSPSHQAAQLQELRNVVDLFVVPAIHNRKLLKGFEGKIIVGNSWRPRVRNLQTDDLVLHIPTNIIPLPPALLFFKLYDGFPSPIRFRLKWNVYGYFYQHPNRTRLYPENEAALTIGDLNHYGGWYCEHCLEELNETMQDAVGDGVYSDKQTQLLHAYSSQPDFAPEFMLNNSWQFDSLLTNFYNKLDYN